MNKYILTSLAIATSALIIASLVLLIKRRRMYSRIVIRKSPYLRRKDIRDRTMRIVDNDRHLI